MQYIVEGTIDVHLHVGFQRFNVLTQLENVWLNYFVSTITEMFWKSKELFYLWLQATKTIFSPWL